MNRFVKYHGLGNDYIIIDPEFSSYTLTRELIKLICHRNLGIGSDGILYGPIAKPNQPLFLRIFNPDGSEAEKSGNGLRIFALYALDQKYTEANNFSLYTASGEVKIKIKDKRNNIIKVSLGKFSFLNKDISTIFKEKTLLNIHAEIMGRKEIINCVNIGNPHCVLIKDQVSKDMVKKIGPILEKSHYFSKRTNVQIVELLDKKNIKIEIWERGVGYTMASGTSSAAASCVANKLGLVEKNITVHMPGGKVQIEIKDNNAYLTGPVSRVASGTISQELIDYALSNITY